MVFVIPPRTDCDVSATHGRLPGRDRSPDPFGSGTNGGVAPHSHFGSAGWDAVFISPVGHVAVEAGPGMKYRVSESRENSGSPESSSFCHLCTIPSSLFK